MAEVTEETVRCIEEAFSRKSDFPLTIWEKVQLARAWAKLQRLTGGLILMPVGNEVERCREIRERAAAIQVELEALTAEHSRLLGVGKVDATDIAWAKGEYPVCEHGQLSGCVLCGARL